MLELLRAMIKEELRLHTHLVGVGLFFLFPFLLIIIIMTASFYAPLVELLSDGSLPGLIFHLLFLFFGMNIGAFGLYGKEFMNRRFGQASLISYSSRTLPISLRRIFSFVILKDTIYYFVMFILPVAIGIEIASSIQGASYAFSLYLLLSLTLSFLLGLSLVFFFSTIYAHSTFFLFLALALAGVLASLVDPALLFPPYAYFIYHDLLDLILTVALITILSGISILFFKVDHPERRTAEKNAISGVAIERLLITKDYLDLRRSRGGVGRIIFSLIFPMALIWLFVSFFVSYLPIVDFLLVFSIFLGVYSSSIYSWLCEYDSYAIYSFLPITIGKVITAKIRATIALGMIPLLIFISAAVFSKTSGLTLVYAFCCFISLFFYGLGATIFLTGLTPNISFFNAKNLLRYLVYIVPPPIVFLVMAVVRPDFLPVSLVLFLGTAGMIAAGMTRWERSEPDSY